MSNTDLENHLFFMARNLSIELMLRRVEDYFREQKLVVVTKWLESSFPNANIRLAVLGKDEHARLIHLGRDRKADSLPSECVYSILNIQSSEYYRYKKPNVAVRFDECLSSDNFKDFITKEVAKLNYPFQYKPLSVF